MSKAQIKKLVAQWARTDGLSETGIDGVQLFRVTEPVQCAPAVYEPTIVAILSGSKEAILDGKSYVYDSEQYLCCSMTLPVEAGTPAASPEDPLLGVSISLDPKIMAELVMEMGRAGGVVRAQSGGELPPSFALAQWDQSFTDALLRLLELISSPIDRAVLGKSRLRELFYAILTGEAGASAKRAFGVGNEMAQAIEKISSKLDEPVTIDDLADQVGMSRAVFHRKFKQATTMSPIQFVKAMRLNSAAMKIAGGMTVNEAAMGVGYVSASQFNREFKRLYGQSPKQWSKSSELQASKPVSRSAVL